MARPDEIDAVSWNGDDRAVDAPLACQMAKIRVVVPRYGPAIEDAGDVVIVRIPRIFGCVI